MKENGLRCILAPNPSPMTLDGTRTYVVGVADLAVIDPGPSIPRHLANLLAALNGVTPAAIILTHGHADHSGCAVALARATGAPLWMAPGSLADRVPEGDINHWIAEGDVVETDAGTLRMVATPGHAPEHVSVHWFGKPNAAGDALFVGDLFMGEGDTTLVAPPEGDLVEYLRSIDRIESIGPRILYPAHGPAIGDPTEAIGRYRRHRLERIEQVRRSIETHPAATPEDLVDLVYGASLDERLRTAARGSIEAVVRYLRVTDCL